MSNPKHVVNRNYEVDGDALIWPIASEQGKPEDAPGEISSVTRSFEGTVLISAMAVTSPKSEFFVLTRIYRSKRGSTDASKDSKRKASDEPASPDSQQQASKKARTDSPEKEVGHLGFIPELE